ncbi:MAG: hypothetical protein J6334_11910 [Kiritimatiellae bacterium]|nr:hypothetical protein [Kiritimatiellia bacterium]
MTESGEATVTLPACGRDLHPGKPILPAFPVTLPIPERRKVSRIEILRQEERIYPLPAPISRCGSAVTANGQIPPAPAPDPAEEADWFYPASGYFGERTDPADGRSVLTLTLAPLRVNPRRNALAAAGRLVLTVTLEPDDATPSRTLLDAPEPLPPGRYSYLVIAPADLLENTPPPWNFQTLCQAREAAGHETMTVSTEWIDNRYTAPNQAERIRAFVQDAHRQWGIRYLLLGGTRELIPSPLFHMRVASIPTAYESDFCADAIFYGCLDGPMDGNGNGRYGELTDGGNRKDIDLTAEVLVGRFPVANPEELAHMVRKTLAYEGAAPAACRPNAFIGERIDAGTQIYGDAHMEQIRLGSTAMSLESYGYLNGPFAPLFETTTLYESPTFTWSAAEALAFLDADWHTVNHLGHASWSTCIKIPLDQEVNRAALAAFTNAMPWIIYSQACDAGAFNHPDCFAEQLVTAPAAAAAAIMNADKGWFFMNTVGGPSQQFQRTFWDAAFRGEGATLGECQECSRQINLYQLGTTQNYWRWAYLGLTLFADPATPFAPSVNPTPVILHHEPLLNTYIEDVPYEVACALTPIGLYNPESPALIWEADTAPGLLHTQQMSVVSGNRFRSEIPAHPRGTRIRYRLTARNHAGIESRFPQEEPITFAITERLTLQILGSPDTLGVPVPDYGTHFSASGRWITVTAPETVYLSDDERFTFDTFIGTGSIPQRGTDSCTFQIHQSSALVWMGERQYRTTLTVTNNLVAPRVFWTAENGRVPIPNLPQTVDAADGNRYLFSEWILDGIRTPNPPGACDPAGFRLTASSPHTLVARYLPETEDADKNGLQDWWERKYFGFTGCSPTADPDSDGYTLAEEQMAWTNPLSGDSYPRPPAIAFTPLPSVLDHPAPYTLEVTLSDPREVIDAVIEWQAVNASDTAWRAVSLTAQDAPSRFAAAFATNATPGTLIRYRVAAANPYGLQARSEAFESFIAYPILDGHLLDDRETVAHTTQSVEQVTAYLFNIGNRPLTGSVTFAAEDPITPERLREWDLTSVEQPWLLSTNRFASPPYALHAQLTSDIQLAQSTHASITLAPCTPGSKAVLSFDHWIQGENDTLNPRRAFDGGIVEYSVDGGETYHLLNGPYTHTIYGWECSPWPDGTPCFSGTGEEGWRHVVFDLAEAVPELNGFAGQTVRFRFHMGGDNNTDNEGWYIDNIRVSPLAGDLPVSVEPESGFAVNAGDYLPLLLNLFPQRAIHRDQTLKIEIASNDPALPLTGFFWSFKLREEPSFSLTAGQKEDGSGRMALAGSFSDRDGEPLTVSIHGTVDAGTNWMPIALTDLNASIQTNLPATAPTGVIRDLATFTDAPATNLVTALWDSRTPLPALQTHTQLLFRVTADNGFFPRTVTFGPFVLDNEPPRFPQPPVWSCPDTPTEDGYVILMPDTVAEPLITWLPAIDFSGVTTQRLNAVITPMAAEEEPLTVELPPDIGAYRFTPLGTDTRVIVTLTARDRFGNESEALLSTFTLLAPTGDFDGDGFSNEAEVEAGTSPVNAKSRFSVGFARDPATGLPALVWPSVPGRVYCVETTDSLLSATWRIFADGVEGTGEPIILPLPVDRPAAFFRLRVRKAQL